eukprot:9840002-Karenia_brevis.AAC.1
MEWQRKARCFECRVDNAVLASWLNGTAVCCTSNSSPRVATLQATFLSMIESDGWDLRHPWANWVEWVPRERNILADALANYALDGHLSFAVYGDMPGQGCNFVAVSDGASRSGTGVSSASWAILAFVEQDIVLVAAGAKLFDAWACSQEAETVGLEMAVTALRQVGKGFVDMIPHKTDAVITANEFMQNNRFLYKYEGSERKLRAFN